MSCFSCSIMISCVFKSFSMKHSCLLDSLDISAMSKKMLSHFFALIISNPAANFSCIFCFGVRFLQFATSSFKNTEIRWETTSKNTTNERNNENNENNSLEFLKMLRIESCCPFFITCHVLPRCFFFSFPVFPFIFPCILHVSSLFYFPFFSRVRFFFASKLPQKTRGQRFPYMPC